MVVQVLKQIPTPPSKNIKHCLTFAFRMLVILGFQKRIKPTYRRKLTPTNLPPQTNRKKSSQLTAANKLIANIRVRGS